MAASVDQKLMGYLLEDTPMLWPDTDLTDEESWEIMLLSVKETPQVIVRSGSSISIGI